MTFFSLPFLLFFPVLILGVFISISSSSLFGAWLGLELNLLSFIPLISMKINSFLSEAALKYFLIQALGSATLIMASSLYLSLENFSFLLIVLSLLLKLGAAPFYFWFPQVIKGLYWPQVVILLTIQKIAPMVLLSYFMFSSLINKMLLLSSILSAIVGALGGLNTLNLRKIIAFSSINHMSWMLIALIINFSLWFLYFFIYSIIASSLVVLFNLQQSYFFSDIFNYYQPKSFFSFINPLALLSLGGLPPFTGFIPKWIIIQAMLQSHMYITLLFLLSSALVTLYYYLRISIPFFTMFSFSLFFSSKQEIPMFLFMFLIFMNFLGIFLPFWSFLI
uniref:NADH-ubiquinone oxidoreductase chain 2 n=1 Tax=Scyra compressipes TaxID=1235674 RepID=A0A891S8J7_9EUCA|nr:NADH dehydrogenase subunit 2 [Scyra compressipes]QRM82011.1 NADH dehydrogenase subunit 2 [Scyra compressipes]